MNLEPDLTIGLICYNAEKSISIAIESLIKQNYQNFKLIIIDDCSTDDTFRICSKYATLDNRILLIRNKNNIGQIKNFWKVFEMTDTEYFMWAAQDDYWEIDYIKTLLNTLKDNPEFSLSFCWTRVFDPNDNQTTKYFKPSSTYFSSTFLNVLAEFINPCVNKYYGIYRTNHLKKFDYKKYFLYDYSDNLVIDFINLNYKTIITPKILFNYAEEKNKIRKSLDPKINKYFKIFKFNHFLYNLQFLRIIFKSDLLFFNKLFLFISSMIIFYIKKFLK